MKLKSDTKFVEESTRRFKIGIRNLRKLDPTFESVKNFHLNEVPSSKVYIFWAKKSIEELPFMKLKRDVKFAEEPTHFKIGIRSLRRFDPSTQKSQKFSF